MKSWIASVLCVVVVAGFAVWRMNPPGVAPASSVPADAFSAERAMATVRTIARAPHPTGSRENDRVRADLLAALAKLGVDALVQTASVVRTPTADFTRAATVQNIVARIPGTGGTGKAVLLAAHYDSVPTGPGAGDDAAGVAAILETVRALRAGPPLRNDVLILLSDGEELGLLGATAFQNAHPWAKNVGLVLNFEGRGARGPVLMFETTDGNAALIEGFAAAVPRPTLSNSLMVAIYKLLANDTDLTVLRAGGAAGLNFAQVDAWQQYHTALDTPDRLDIRSVQQHGNAALALVRHFGDIDLARLRSDADAVYFDVLGAFVVRYPRALSLPLTILTTLCFAAVVAVGLRRKRWTVKGFAVGVVAFPVAVGAAAGLATGAGMLIARLHPAYQRVPWGALYNGVWYELAFVLIAAAVVLAVYAPLTRRFAPEDLALGALVLWLSLAWCVTLLLPTGAFWLQWPLLFALLGLAVHDRPIWSIVAALPGIVLIAPLLHAFFLLLNVQVPGLIAALAALVLGLLVRYLEPVPWPALIAAVGCVACLAIGGATADAFDTDHRAISRLVYAVDADSGKAIWVTGAIGPSRWNAPFFRSNPRTESIERFLPWIVRPFRVADADGPDLPRPTPPRVTVLRDTNANGRRTLLLRVSSLRGARCLIVHAPGQREITVNGKPAAFPLLYTAPGDNGIVVSLNVSSRASVRLTVADIVDGLPSIVPARPKNEMSVPDFPATDCNIVRTTYLFQ